MESYRRLCTRFYDADKLQAPKALVISICATANMPKDPFLN